MWQLEDSQKQLVLKGGRGPSFTGTTPPSQLSYTQHLLLLLCLAVTESCSCDHIGSPLFQPGIWSCYRGAKSFHTPPYLVASLSFGSWGTLLPTCTPDVFSRTFRELNCVQFGVACIHHCPFYVSFATQPMYSFLCTMASCSHGRRLS